MKSRLRPSASAFAARIARPSASAFAARIAILLCAASLCIGCAVVKINPDSTDSVEHGGGEDVGRNLANRVCHKAKATRAEVISTVKKDDKAPEGKGRYVTTFRCIY
jgi:hypothetical protein